MGAGRLLGCSKQRIGAAAAVTRNTSDGEDKEAEADSHVARSRGAMVRTCPVHDISVAKANPTSGSATRDRPPGIGRAPTGSIAG
jgi:hypothetical protein